MDIIEGFPFWEFTFDADGRPAPGNAALVAEIKAQGITDLVFFSHGWNNSHDMAMRLYTGFFTLLARQAHSSGTTKLGLAGVFWPSQRWSDEPIPDFTAPAAVIGAASLETSSDDDGIAVSERLEPETLAGLRDLFPAAAASLDRMAEILATATTDDDLRRFQVEMSAFTAAAGSASIDAADLDLPGVEPETPPMLATDPATMFGTFADKLEESGAVLAAPGDGAAGLLSDARKKLARALHGAKEALRQLTYWQMKQRAGIVGQKGLGPLLTTLPATVPGLRIHLVGHSFGARLVSYALTGVPANATPSPVKAVTLLEGAFSQWVLAPKLRVNPDKHGALAGYVARVDGPFVVVHSNHDSAVGTFYPLASLAAQDDSAGLGDADSRWGGIGANGAQGVSATATGLRSAGSAYPFVAQKVFNVDASAVVRHGGPPAGAHSDIVHPELTWIVLSAGRVVPV